MLVLLSEARLSCRPLAEPIQAVENAPMATMKNTTTMATIRARFLARFPVLLSKLNNVNPIINIGDQSHVFLTKVITELDLH